MKSLRLPKIDRSQSFEIEIDGNTIKAYSGETIATVLHAAGIRLIYVGESNHSPSRLYCNMGVCQQCLISVDHTPNCQACKTLAQPGMKVETHP